MADTTQLEAASRPTSSASRIALKILSPGSGVPETIDINDVPTDITIGILKSRITLISPSTPPADHQRLIYQGRVLANPSTKLADVFGADAVCLLGLVVSYRALTCDSFDSTSHSPCTSSFDRTIRVPRILLYYPVLPLRRLRMVSQLDLHPMHRPLLCLVSRMERLYRDLPTYHPSQAFQCLL